MKSQKEYGEKLNVYEKLKITYLIKKFCLKTWFSIKIDLKPLLPYRSRRRKK